MEADMVRNTMLNNNYKTILSIFTKKIQIMKSDNICLKYEGQQHQIDANTLINTLTHYNALLMQVNSLISDNPKDISLKIKAPERGSFILNIDIVESVTSIFSNNTVSYLSDLTQVAVFVFGAYKVFKGRKVNDTEIKDVLKNFKTIKVERKTILEIYNNQVVRSSISKSIETASEDSAIDGIEISNNHGGDVSIEKEEFPDMIYDEFDKEAESECLDSKIKHEIVPEAVLSIMVVSFDKRTKWRFIYNGIKLPPMDMKDVGLQKNIDDGMSFSKGDAILVKLEVTKEFNPAYNAYENKKYRILEVIKHIPRVKQYSFEIE